MKTSKERLAAIKEYDRAHRAFKTIALPKETLQRFLELAKQNHEKPNTLLRGFIEDYIERHS